jgi:type VI secretion system protein ImpK
VDRVNWVTHECFNAIRQLRKVSADPAMNATHLQARTARFVDAMLKKAGQAGYGTEDARLMAYAIVALADEIAMASSGPLRDAWSKRTLQLAYFNENVAGENFFAHLERIRRDAGRIDVLRVFYTALMFGFQGKHRIRGAELELTDLIENLRKQLAQSLKFPEHLSPDGQRPEETVFLGQSRIPVVWIGAGLLVLAVVFYLGLQVSLRNDVSSLLAWMNEHLRPEASAEVARD